MGGKIVQASGVALTGKQRAFVEEYLKCWNASEAARRAGYSARDADSRGCKLLKLANVRAVVQARLEERAMETDEVLAQLAEQARGNLGDYLIVEGEEGKEEVRFDLARLVRDGKGHLLRAVTVNKVRIEFYNAQAALGLLAKHQGLFREQKEQDEENSGTISLAEWEEMVEERMARVSALMLKWGMVTPEELGVGEGREDEKAGLEGARLLTG
jgi:phage terminase small subunit